MLSLGKLRCHPEIHNFQTSRKKSLGYSSSCWSFQKDVIFYPSHNSLSVFVPNPKLQTLSPTRQKPYSLNFGSTQSFTLNRNPSSQNPNPSTQLPKLYSLHTIPKSLSLYVKPKSQTLNPTPYTQNLIPLDLQQEYHVYEFLRATKN